MKICLTILLAAAGLARAHRLDEYLQGALVSVEKDRVHVQMTLTPGVAVLPVVLAGIDRDSDGSLSAPEQRSYAVRVLRDLSLKIDGRVLIPRLISQQFSSVAEMNDGLGEVRIEFEADLPAGGSKRRLVLENHHQSSIAAYQVNCLVPRDRDIRIIAQERNYTQSHYELDYEQAGSRSGLLSFVLSSGGGWLAAIAILLLGRLTWLWFGGGWRPLPHGRGSD
jgi:hypothetical protein